MELLAGQSVSDKPVFLSVSQTRRAAESAPHTHTVVWCGICHGLASPQTPNQGLEFLMLTPVPAAARRARSAFATFTFTAHKSCARAHDQIAVSCMQQRQSQRRFSRPFWKLHSDARDACISIFGAKPASPCRMSRAAQPIFASGHGAPAKQQQQPLHRVAAGAGNNSPPKTDPNTKLPA